MVNKSAILGSLISLICLFSPWWQYKASGMGLNVDLTVNPWGYGGSVSDLANKISGIGSLGSSGFSTLSDTLGVAGLLVIAGSLIGLSSSFVRGSWGRGSVALAGSARAWRRQRDWQSRWSWEMPKACLVWKRQRKNGENPVGRPV